jgi:hypothetical protein
MGRFTYLIWQIFLKKLNIIGILTNWVLGWPYFFIIGARFVTKWDKKGVVFCRKKREEEDIGKGEGIMPIIT